jgi:purine nucleosidase
MAKKIIIDTDPGIDDALAICTALRSPEFEIVGLTSVFGNAAIDQTTLNSLRLVELEDNTAIPVVKGCASSLVIPTPPLGTYVHGEDGFGNTHMPPPKGRPLDISAAEFIIQTVMSNPGEITLVPIGPLTNIALALRIEPSIAQLVHEVVIMGGAAVVKGNASPVAEANIWHDPHAADIVFAAGWPLTMVGLDVTTRVCMSSAYLDALVKADTPPAHLIRQILPCYLSYFKQKLGLTTGIHTHDPSAIAYLIDPGNFKTEQWPVYVETVGSLAGQTTPDIQSHWADQRKPINVCVAVNADPILEMIFERLTH